MSSNLFNYSFLVLVFSFSLFSYVISKNLEVEQNTVKNSLYINNVVIIKGAELNYVPFDEDYCCKTDQDCIEHYTEGIEHVLEKNYSVVHRPICAKKNETQNCGKCKCESGLCFSRSFTFDNDPFYYCGPCGRVGSYCNDTCSLSEMADCQDDYCQCTNGGTFYEAYYCYIPYYGYEVALQMAISTCIVIALCLLIASIYNAIGFRRLRRRQGTRDAFRLGENGVRDGPPGDTPPKYDDVVEDLPSYQDALQMSNENESPPPAYGAEDGIVNEGFENDSSMNSVRSQSDVDRIRMSMAGSSGARPKEFNRPRVLEYEMTDDSSQGRRDIYEYGSLNEGPVCLKYVQRSLSTISSSIENIKVPDTDEGRVGSNDEADVENKDTINSSTIKECQDQHCLRGNDYEGESKNNEVKLTVESTDQQKSEPSHEKTGNQSKKIDLTPPKNELNGKIILDEENHQQPTSSNPTDKNTSSSIPESPKSVNSSIPETTKSVNGIQETDKKSHRENCLVDPTNDCKVLPEKEEICDAKTEIKDQITDDSQNDLNIAIASCHSQDSVV